MKKTAPIDLRVLVEISTSLASIRDRKQLFATIFGKIKPIIPVDDTGLLVLDKTGTRWQDWSNVDNYQNHPAATQLLQLGYDGWQPLDRALEYTLNHSSMMTVAHFREQYPEHPFGAVMWEAGLREMMFTPLVNGGKKLGVLFFDAQQEGSYTQEHLTLFKAFADLVAVAVANILANEEIIKREREKSVLLSISEDIASVRDKVDLLRVVVEKIKPLFAFYDCGILVVDRNNRFHDLSAIHPGIDGSQVNELLNQQGFYRNQGLAFEGSALQATMQRIEKAQQPVIHDYLADTSAYSDHQLVSLIHQQGYQDAVAGLLKTGGKAFGCFFINYLQAGLAAGVPKVLFQNVVDQLSVAVANILANEEILEREWEKSVLLSISRALVTIHDRKQLFRVIYEQIRPIFPYDGAGLFIINEGEDTHYEFTDESYLDSPDERLIYQPIGRGPFPHKGSIIEYVMQHETPLVLNLKEFEQAYSHPQIPLMLKVGYRQIIAGSLVKGGRKFGMICFSSKQNDCYSQKYTPLFGAIAEQLAVVMANILANEEILQREREKSVLLSISEALATIRDKQQLLKVVFEKVRPLFGFYDTGLFVLDSDRQYIEDWTVTLPEVDPSTSNIQLRSQGASRIGYKDSVMEWAINQLKGLEGPKIFPYNEEVVARFPDYPQFAIIKQVGYQESLAALLRTDRGELGILFFNSLLEGHFQAAQFTLFQAIADQVAVAVANILANEEILEREREKSLQIALINALAAQPVWEEKFRVVAQLLNEALPLDTLTVSFNAPDQPRFYFYEKRPNGKLHWVQVEAFLHKVGLTWQQLGQLRRQIQPHYAQSGLYTGEAHRKQCEQYPLKDLLRCHYGLQSSLVLPLQMDTATQQECVLLLGSRQAEGFTSQHFALLQELTPQIALATEKLLAHQDIQTRESEQALQLGLIEALQSESTWRARYLRFARTLQKHLPFDYLILELAGDRDPERIMAFLRIGAEEYQCIDAEAFLRITRTDPRKYDALRATVPYRESLLLNGGEFEQFSQKHPLMALIAHTFGLKSNLVLPLKLSRHGRFLVSLLRKKPDGYRPADKLLLERLAGSLTNVLEKLLAFEEVERLKEKLEVEKEYLEAEIQTGYSEIIGSSAAIKSVFRQVSQVADTDVTVLILGETGTGKELVARALHQASSRKDKVLVKLNCAALPATLIESELFGHEKGAFTGAVERRIGKFELASGSSIFLDEVGELPPELQTKLLRVLQEKEFERLGSNKVIRCDVRIIAATNRNLEKEVREGRFRQDLYYRLNVFPVHLPPLRERREDIPLLAVHFTGKYAKKLGRKVTGISSAAIKQMQAYPWPGNIRELEHVVERAVITTSNGTIQELSLPRHTEEALTISKQGLSLKTLDEAERELIIRTLRHCNGRIRGKGGAAELLNILPNTLDYRMKKLGLSKQFIFNSTGP